MDLVVIAVAGVAAVGVALFAWVLVTRARMGSISTRQDELASEVRANLNHLSSQLTELSAQVRGYAGETSFNFGAVRKDLGVVTGAAERIREIGRDITELNGILRAPKLRGGMGEFLLEDLLRQSLPEGAFAFQHAFSTGARVDAVVKLDGRMVPVDAKFPLEGFRRILEAEGEDQSRAARRGFLNDCKRHVDKIASSYILPEEGTLSFALMYIPAENVYYETILKDSDGSLAEYAFARRVIPVSPASFYAYLQTILMGLRGLEIDERASLVLEHLERLGREFDSFSSDVETLGRHITNARAKYEEVRAKTERFSSTLDSVHFRTGGRG